MKVLDNLFPKSSIFCVKKKKEFNMAVALGRLLLLHLVHDFLKIYFLYSATVQGWRCSTEAQAIPVPGRLIQVFSAPDPQK